MVEDELLISLELCDGLRVLRWQIVGPATTVAERLRSLGVPFVYCAGYEQPSTLHRRAEDTVVRKPVNMRLLTQQLRTLKRAA